jgi:hypothetical protein
LSWWPRKKEKVEGVTFQPLEDKAGFVLDIEGQKIAAMRLPGMVAREIAGEVGAGATSADVKAKYGSEIDQKWLIVTNMQNPLLQDYDRFALLTSQGLTTASGAQVPRSNLVVSTGSSVTAKCNNCGKEVSPNLIGPCPFCGKEGKSISLKLGEPVGIKD